jgi:virginiamycin B lyase
MSIATLSIFSVPIFSFACLFSICALFITYDNNDYALVYAQGSDIPLKITILEHKSNRTNSDDIIVNNIAASESPTMTTGSRQEGFMKDFCGINSTAAGESEYVIEYNLPQSCEMPLGIAVDSEDNEVWYVSTKRGTLSMYDIAMNRFEQYTIPQWYVRENPIGFSQVWDLKIDNEDGGDSDEIWFTDMAQNAIWRFKKSTEQFEFYRIPAQSESFGTIYPITIDIVTNRSTDGISDDSDINNKNEKDKSVYFIGTFVPSLWYAEIDELKNGTSNGMHEIKLPTEYGFKNIDPFYVTSGSFEYDEDRNSIWITMLSYSRKGQILEYNLDSKTFNIFGLPDDLSSPLGIAIGDNSNLNNDNQAYTTKELWITNPGTNIFYNYEISEQEKKKDNNKNRQTEVKSQSTSYDINIEKYTTLLASPRIFGLPFSDNSNWIKDDDPRNGYYTLPSWIKKATDGSIWFNQQHGNKISRFDPSRHVLVEYWIPSQNNEWGNCEDKSKNGNERGWIKEHDVRMENCGIANVLNFALSEDKESKEDGEEKEIDVQNSVEEVWFTEWSTNKIGRIDVARELPFDIEIQESDRDLTIKRGESKEIEMVVSVNPATENGKENEEEGKQTSFTNLAEPDDLIIMTAAGTFTSTGYLGNSSGYFDIPQISFDRQANDKDDENSLEQEVSFILSPSENMIPGEYTLMLGAENESVSVSKAIKIHVI